MALEDYTVINADASDFQMWCEENRDRHSDEISKLEIKEVRAKQALTANSFLERVNAVKDAYWLQRLNGLALILGNLYVARNDNLENREKYEKFVKTYKGQIGKAEGN